MLEDSPGITLFLFALPMILGNLFQQFYNMVDSMIDVSYTHLDVYKRQHPET